MMVILVFSCALIGLLIGSFLNVVVARVPAGESVVRPGSHCPACGQPIAARDNVPVLSWLLLRGRARCCGARISPRYPLVEAGTAAFFATVAAWLGASWALPAYLTLAAGSITLALIDVDTLRLPVVVVVPTFAAGVLLLGVASTAVGDTAGVLRAAGGAAALWVLYRALHAAYPRGMGYGDVRLAGVLGLYLAWMGWDRLVVGGFFGFLTGGLGGVLLMLAGRGGLKSQLPYGPYMLLGAWIGLVWGGHLAAWYLTSAGL